MINRTHELAPPDPKLVDQLRDYIRAHTGPYTLGNSVVELRVLDGTPVVKIDEAIFTDSGNEGHIFTEYDVIGARVQMYVSGAVEGMDTGELYLESEATRRLEALLDGRLDDGPADLRPTAQEIQALLRSFADLQPIAD